MDGEKVFVRVAEALVLTPARRRKPWPTTLDSLPAPATVELGENGEFCRTEEVTENELCDGEDRVWEKRRQWEWEREQALPNPNPPPNTHRWGRRRGAGEEEEGGKESNEKQRKKRTIKT